ncbi:hypothetical protein [Burkholderia gladioli]|uniref:hypothetical protein n=1 Tax=Burkholderia gladioli TaxID=28095 RepID=UPI0021B2558A|nr:hypothetical protein [Burkholderia gladioli]
MSEEAAGRKGAGGKGGAAAAGCLLAIDFGGTKIAMATATPSGERLGEAEIPTLAAEGAARVLARTREASLALLARTRRDQRGRAMRAHCPCWRWRPSRPASCSPTGSGSRRTIPAGRRSRSNRRCAGCSRCEWWAWRPT